MITEHTTGLGLSSISLSVSCWGRNIGASLLNASVIFVIALSMSILGQSFSPSGISFFTKQSGRGRILLQIYMHIFAMCANGDSLKTCNFKNTNFLLFPIIRLTKRRETYFNMYWGISISIRSMTLKVTMSKSSNNGPNVPSNHSSKKGPAATALHYKNKERTVIRKWEYAIKFDVATDKIMGQIREHWP